MPILEAGKTIIFKIEWSEGEDDIPGNLSRSPNLCKVVAATSLSKLSRKFLVIILGPTIAHICFL